MDGEHDGLYLYGWMESMGRLYDWIAWLESTVACIDGWLDCMGGLLHGWIAWLDCMDEVHGWIAWLESLMALMDGFHGWIALLASMDVSED